MKEYKIIETKKNEAEQIMNEMSKQGWEVVSVTHWRNAWAMMFLLITFSKEK